MVGGRCTGGAHRCKVKQGCREDRSDVWILDSKVVRFGGRVQSVPSVELFVDLFWPGYQEAPKERLYAAGETPSEFPKCSLSTEAELNPASAATRSIES